jgi:hypothetical protein
MLVASGPYSAIDPCAGDGTALLEITRDSAAHLSAIEIDAARAAGCIQREIKTVHGSAIECNPDTSDYKARRRAIADTLRVLECFRDEKLDFPDREINQAAS